jgi:protein YibB
MSATEPFTLVTALVNINREEWDGKNKQYARKWNEYLNFLSMMALRMNVPLYIFVEKDTIDFVLKHRNNPKTYVKVIDFKDYKLYPQRERIAEIQSSETYRAHGVEESPETHIPEYNIAVNNKVAFLDVVARENPYRTDYFVWLDAGYGHGRIEIPRDYAWYPENYLKKASTGKIVINTLLDEMKTSDPVEFFAKHVDFIDGGMVVGNAAAIAELYRLYYSIIDDTMSGVNHEGIIDDDQYYMAMTSARYPQLFNLVRIAGWGARKDVLLC